MNGVAKRKRCISMGDEKIEFAIDNETAVEFLGDLVEHLEQTGRPLWINSGLGCVDLGVEGCIFLSFMPCPPYEYGKVIAIDPQPEEYF